MIEGDPIKTEDGGFVIPLIDGKTGQQVGPGRRVYPGRNPDPPRQTIKKEPLRLGQDASAGDTTFYEDE